ncbi:hypothetical protein [Novipirellula artificiosorum]|uniref:Uncharacterized protein n=1 Tax=Novipirellula artificiosorum TaxID=2528016 RepID=A0A5C6D9W9_9BACT|nr:hypothetical protein [Novipirellula artificiosorum]TWU32594.1 hypothetical protein Poly41_55720 [Novipirellula artificiosorum]
MPKSIEDVLFEIVSVCESMELDFAIMGETPFQQSIMQRRQRFELSSHWLYFVTPEDLILLKLLANRPRDLGDVADVIFVQGELDQKYLQQWAGILGITDRLNENLTPDA